MTAEKILSIARAQLGVKESPAGSNKVKYNTAYYGREVKGSSYPWCCVFIWWLFQQAGAAALFFGGEKTAYCPTLLNYYKSKGQLVTSGYKPGDIVFFNFSGGKTAKHVGVCTAWDGTNITTIDGNTGTTNEANGGAVMERKRHKKYIVGVARPAYTGATTNKPKGGNTVEVTLPVLQSGDKGESVRALQILLNGKGYSCGKVDGIYGPKTVTAVTDLQKDAFPNDKKEWDGCTGKKTWTAILTT